jgi:hypothetical protein
LSHFYQFLSLINQPSSHFRPILGHFHRFE